MRLSLRDHFTKKIHVVSETTSIAEASKTMRNHWIRHLPVVDSEEQFVVGILSDRDLTLGSNPSAPVKSVMTTPVKFFDLGTPLTSVLQAMIQEKVSAFLITEKDEVVGIVTTEDMLVVLQEILKDDTSRNWTMAELLMNPVLQRTINMISQAGI